MGAICFALIVVGLVCLPLDIAVSSRFVVEDAQQWHLPGEIEEIIALSETFAHGFGVLLICLGVFVLDRRSWKLAILPFSTAIGAGLFANVVKMLGVSRYRPRAFFELETPVIDSFQEIFPLFRTGSLQGVFDYFGQSDLHSIPSAHAATAAGFWVGLTALYPQGRWYFAVLALLSGLQRIVSGSHFPSDVCFGYAVGLIFATFLVRLKFIQKLQLLPDEA